MKVYVASSWRNEQYPAVVEALREAGHEVYDFRNPEPGNNGFRWQDLDPDHERWTADTFRAALNHPIAQEGFAHDFNAMQWADACVMVMPCGRSAHLELGWFTGQGKLSIILLESGEPELMYLCADRLCLSVQEVIEELWGYEGVVPCAEAPEEVEDEGQDGEILPGLTGMLRAYGREDEAKRMAVEYLKSHQVRRGADDTAHWRTSFRGRER